ncbi:MAG: CorA family divalent cation transporter [Chitinophagaceae bacterium]
MRVYYQDECVLKNAEGAECLSQVPFEKIFWIDLQFSTSEERTILEGMFKINFRQLKSENALESNARFYESDNLVFISANFIALQEGHYESTPVFLYLMGEILITERNADLVSFTETIKKIRRNPKGFTNGSDVLGAILETKYDVDADFVDHIAKDIATVGRSLSLKETDEIERMLLKINGYQEATTLSRDSFIDKHRVASALLKSNGFKNKERLKILMKDITTMLENTSFILVRLEYLQNTILGLINIAQNKTIKIFTIVAVVFMPPTLIASIYGMNFKIIPELSWSFGYPLALILIVGSSMLTLLVFKKKRWL